MTDDEDHKTPPTYRDLDKFNIQQLEQKRLEDLESLNEPEDHEPSPTPTGNLKSRALDVNREVLEIQKQRIQQVIKENETEIARQKAVKNLAKQFAKKMRADKDREERDRGH
jgi:hypothetical protein